MKSCGAAYLHKAQQLNQKQYLTQRRQKEERMDFHMTSTSLNTIWGSHMLTLMTTHISDSKLDNYSPLLLGDKYANFKNNIVHFVHHIQRCGAHDDMTQVGTRATLMSKEELYHTMLANHQKLFLILYSQTARNQTWAMFASLMADIRVIEIESFRLCIQPTLLDDAAFLDELLVAFHTDLKELMNLFLTFFGPVIGSTPDMCNVLKAFRVGHTNCLPVLQALELLHLCITSSRVTSGRVVLNDSRVEPLLEAIWDDSQQQFFQLHQSAISQALAQQVTAISQRITDIFQRANLAHHPVLTNVLSNLGATRTLTNAEFTRLVQEVKFDYTAFQQLNDLMLTLCKSSYSVPSVYQFRPLDEGRVQQACVAAFQTHVDAGQLQAKVHRLTERSCAQPPLILNGPQVSITEHSTMSSSLVECGGFGPALLRVLKTSRVQLGTLEVRLDAPAEQMMDETYVLQNICNFHPHWVHCLGWMSSPDGSTPFLLLEPLCCLPLSRLLTATAAFPVLPLRLAIGWMKDTLGALAYLHELGFDLASFPLSNIVIDNAFVAKITGVSLNRNTHEHAILFRTDAPTPRESVCAWKNHCLQMIVRTKRPLSVPMDQHVQEAMQLLVTRGAAEHISPVSITLLQSILQQCTGPSSTTDLFTQLSVMHSATGPNLRDMLNEPDAALMSALRQQFYTQLSGQHEWIMQCNRHHCAVTRKHCDK